MAVENKKLQVSGLFGSFQWPAYSAATTLMVPKKHYARTSGLISMADSGVGIIAPILAAMLMPMIGVIGVIAIDLVTLVIALGFLLVVLIPEPKNKQPKALSGAFLGELAYGFRYLFNQRSLLYLQLVFFFGNLFSSLAFTLINP